ncbi:MAG: tryptophan 2,3-dioxygenase [Gammaproteobacteria bacterium]|jgi:tryptophan 2,3-dioxygenase|nr:tryptophan 2,3-dioxygenase [Gammaproteobacteria bacterium]MBT5203417.1 tryptophan 2,3-dioxygenase [Gammaproteobacteria bacterium]MBT5602651.1 tryptophan 2,3-dioxygenase [Gammaproteobacteria bacterium]MBT6245640.1 tryptophan 2,3-dioxygenase [Gammaproteobacteria bacterium]
MEVKSIIVDGVETFETEINGERIQWDSGLTYAKHIQTKQLLATQIPVSDKPDELLFIIMHQTMELWIKLCLHEVKIALKAIQDDELAKAFKTFDRIATVQRHMIDSWEVLATLSPHDFLTFRGYLRKASGFQSYQYRQLEFLLGNRNADLIVVHQDDEAVLDELKATLAMPSLYDEVLQLLGRRGLTVPEHLLNRDWQQQYEPSDEVENLWKAIYENVEENWDLYTLAEKITALEYYFHEWRFKHMKTVSRVIGFKKGTGGSSGVSYLVKALEYSFFPELWSVRTTLENVNAGDDIADSRYHDDE